MYKQKKRLLDRNQDRETGVDPTIVVVDKGVAKSLLTTTATKTGVNAFIFVQKGLITEIGLQDSKISYYSNLVSYVTGRLIRC